MLVQLLRHRKLTAAERDLLTDVLCESEGSSDVK
jgi:hypothetical protein